MKQVFLDDLPLKKVNNRNYIDWDNSNNHIIKFIHDSYSGELKVIKYEKHNNHIFFEYDNNKYELNKNSLVECRLSKILKGKNKKSIYKIGDLIINHKRNLIITGVAYKTLKNDKGKRFWYDFTCLNCGWLNGLIMESDLVSGKGCSCCRGFTVVEGINDIPTTAPWMVKYFQGGYDEAKLYTYSSNKRIFPICTDCGNIKDKSLSINKIYTNKSIGCICGDGISYPEKFIYSLLSQLDITFIRQFSKRYDKWCEKYLYDFMIPYVDCIIEANGLQHYCDKNGNWNSLSETQENDKQKEELAKDNYIVNYISLDCRKSELDWIKKSVLESELPTLLNFSENDVDWKKCEEFATSNMIKKICEYKEKNQSLSILDICDNFNLSTSTIKSYIRKGSKLNWCIS